MDAVRDGLAFTRGAAGRQHELTHREPDQAATSRSACSSSRTGAGVALYLTDPVPDGQACKVGVRSRWRSEPYAPKVLKLTLSAAEQTGDGAALLQISSDRAGDALAAAGERGERLARRPVGGRRRGQRRQRGPPGHHRRGGRPADRRPAAAGGFRHHRRRRAAGEDLGNTSSVAVTLTLALPASEIVTPTVRTGTGLYPARLRLRGHEPERRAGWGSRRAFRGGS